MAKKVNVKRPDLRITRRRYQASEYRCYDVVERAMDHLCDDLPTVREYQQRFRDLAPGQRVLVSTQLLQAEVLNGGFVQYFFNSYAMFAAEALDGLQKLGANRHAGILRKAMNIFSDGKVPRDRARRWLILHGGDRERVERARQAMEGGDLWEGIEGLPRLTRRLDAFDDRFCELEGGADALERRHWRAFIEAHLDELVR